MNESLGNDEKRWRVGKAYYVDAGGRLCTHEGRRLCTWDGSLLDSQGQTPSRLRITISQRN